MSVLPKIQFQNYADLVSDVLGTNSHPSTGIFFIFLLGETNSNMTRAENMNFPPCMSSFSLYQSQTGVENPGRPPEGYNPVTSGSRRGGESTQSQLLSGCERL